MSIDIKKICKNNNLTYKQLSDSIGVSESSLKSAVSTKKISKQIEKAIGMYLRIKQLENELEKANTFKQALKDWIG